MSAPKKVLFWTRDETPYTWLLIVWWLENEIVVATREFEDTGIGRRWELL